MLSDIFELNRVSIFAGAVFQYHCRCISPIINGSERMYPTSAISVCNQNDAVNIVFNSLQLSKELCMIYFVDYEVSESSLRSGAPNENLTSWLFILAFQMNSVKNRELNVIVLLSCDLSSRIVHVDNILDMSSLLCGSYRVEFAEYCSRLCVQRTAAFAADFCRNKLFINDPVIKQTKNRCTILSTSTIQDDSNLSAGEIWHSDISHPNLPITVYNDEMENLDSWLSF